MKLSQEDQRLLGELCRQNNVSLAKVRKLLEGKLLPGDLEWRESTNEYAWQNNARQSLRSSVPEQGRSDYSIVVMNKIPNGANTVFNFFRKG